MKILTVLQNKFMVDKQMLEIQLENELNSDVSDPNKIDNILDQLARVKLKQQLWDNYVKQIIESHGRNSNNGDEPNE